MLSSEAPAEEAASPVSKRLGAQSLYIKADAFLAHQSQVKASRIMKTLELARLRAFLRRTATKPTLRLPPAPIPDSGLLTLPLELCDEITKHLVNPDGIKWLSRLAQASQACKVIADRALQQLLKPTNYLDQDPCQLTAVTRIDIYHGRDKLNDDSVLGAYIAGLPNLRTLRLQTLSSTLPYLAAKLPDRHLNIHLIHTSFAKHGQEDAEIIATLLDNGKLRSLELTIHQSQSWELLVRGMIVAPPEQFKSLKLSCPRIYGSQAPPAIALDGGLTHLTIEPFVNRPRDENLDKWSARWLFDGAHLSQLQTLHIGKIVRRNTLEVLSEHKYPVMQQLSLRLEQSLSLSDADELTSQMPLLRSTDIAVCKS